MHHTFSASRIEIVRFARSSYMNDLRKDILEGLTALRKFIPSKYFYDTYGSNLFEKISFLPEYYLTRKELSILKKSASSIMDNFQDGDIVELGPGTSRKVKILLDEAYKSNRAAIRYVSIDVSESAITRISKELLDTYSRLRVLGIVADFTKHIEKIPSGSNKLFILFGSTIGNFSEKEAILFLKNIARSMGPNDRFLLGMDMVKPKETLELAYNDLLGITSEFNKNVLRVINRELDANFRLDHFTHTALFHAEKRQVEMYLQANRKISVEIKGLDLPVEMDKGETIHTEISRKFSKEGAERMITEAGLKTNRWFSDPGGWFSLVELVVPKQA